MTSVVFAKFKASANTDTSERSVQEPFEAGDFSAADLGAYLRAERVSPALSNPTVEPDTDDPRPDTIPDAPPVPSPDPAPESIPGTEPTPDANPVPNQCPSPPRPLPGT